MSNRHALLQSMSGLGTTASVRGGAQILRYLWCVPASVSVSLLLELALVRSFGALRGHTLWSVWSSIAYDYWFFLWPFALTLLLQVLANAARVGREGPSWVIRALSVASSLSAAALLQWLLGSDPIFHGYVPAIAASVGFGIGTSVAWEAIAWLAPSRTRLLLVAAGASALGLAAHLVNLTVYVRLYPSFHAAQLCAELSALTLGSFALQRSFQDARFGTRMGSLVSHIALSLLALFPLLHRNTDQAVQSDARRSSVLGAVRGLFVKLDEGRATVAPDPDAIERFARYSGLPPLPTGFDLGKYDVLFVSVDALRYDQTSLFDPSLATTPNLVKLRDEGAFNFTHAFSPSSATFQAISAIMTLNYPSSTEMALAERSWLGTLGSRDPTLAEIFARAGYRTMRVSHNINGVFEHSIHGIGRGFSVQKLIPTPPEDPNVDERILKSALDEIARVPAGQRYFGWVFFVSPHSPYLAHSAEPSAPDLSKYREEVTYADAQIGALIAGLKASGRWKSTLLIVVGDHGEEFREHGGQYHKSTVYTESIHVPLLVRLPGMKGRSEHRVTSTGYVFPWLWLRGPDDMQAHAEKQLTEVFGPMLRDTHGAVVAELLGHDRMETALIYPTHKLDYDFLTDSTELFSLKDDRLEHRNLVSNAALAAPYLARLAAYRRTRTGLASFLLYQPENAREPEKTREPEKGEDAVLLRLP